MGYRVTKTCECCGEQYSVIVDFEEYMQFLEGGNVRFCLPSLTPKEKALVVGGYCEDCYDDYNDDFDDTECEDIF